ncbi:MAG TPA: hypothetical protein VG964_02725 [Candidatus Saccharimonadales bacterium]|nr:hypothetical protein [Candidatus Saccharimonadales bacterium]
MNEPIAEESVEEGLVCDVCGHFPLKPEHAHYVCSECGYKTKCCEGGVC